MNKFMCKIVAVGAIAVLAVGAMAQGQPGGGGRGMGMMGGGTLRTVSRADVQADLKVTAEQKQSIETLNRDQMEKMRGMFGGGPGGGGGGGNQGGPPDMAAMQKQMEALEKEAREKVQKILTADQWTRFKQIEIQLQGIRALLNSDVQKALGITPAQKQDIEKFQQQQQKDMQAMREDMRSGSLNRDDMRAGMDKINKKFEDELTKLLTADQAKAFKDMQGAPFKATEQGRGGGGFGGPPGGGGGRGGGGGTGGGGTGGGN